MRDRPIRSHVSRAIATPAEDETRTQRAISPPLLRYRQRRFEFLGLWNCGDLRMKAYGIAADLNEDNATLPPSSVSAAQVHTAERVGPAVKAEGGHHGLGYVILHRGIDATWLLMDWWVRSEINCHLLSSSTSAEPDTFYPVNRPLSACIWEMVIIEHERRAWTRCMLTDEPDDEAYLADHLRDGRY